MDTELLNKVLEQAAHAEEKIIKQYEYRPAKWEGLFDLFSSIILIPCFSVWLLSISREGLTLYQLLTTLSEIELLIFSPIIFLCLAYGFSGWRSARKAFQEPRFITFYEFKMTTPKKPFSNEIVEIHYKDIMRFKIYNFGVNPRIRRIFIYTNDGLVSISDVSLSDKSIFSDIVQTFESQLQKYDLEI